MNLHHHVGGNLALLIVLVLLPRDTVMFVVDSSANSAWLEDTKNDTDTPQTFFDGQARVLGGGDALFSMGWLTYIQVKGVQDQKACVGSLIHPKWILTSGNCIKSLIRHRWTAWVYTTLGMTSSYQPIPRVLKTKVNIYGRDVFFSNQYRSMFHFVMGPSLIKRTPPADESPYITRDTIEYYNGDDDRQFINRLCYVYGWQTYDPGSSKRDGRRVNDVYVRVLRFEDWKIIGRVPSSVVSPSGLCKGERGSALVCEGVLIGIAESFDDVSCDQRSKDIIFTRISRHSGFIASTIANHGG